MFTTCDDQAPPTVAARRLKQRPAGHVRIHADVPASLFAALDAAAVEHGWRRADVIRGSLAGVLGDDARMASVCRLAAADAAVRACRVRDAARSAARAEMGAQRRPVARTRPVGYVRVNADLPRRMADLLNLELSRRPGLSNVAGAGSQSDVVRAALTLTLGSKTAMAGVERYLQERARSLFTK